MKENSPAPSRKIWRLLGKCSAVLLASCTSPPTTPPTALPAAPPSVFLPTPPPVVATLPASTSISNALTPKDYRRDGARHLYALNAHRIYKGQMPPLMQAVGVLDVELDARGNVRHVSWMRAPSHVPDVMREIERTVRAAAPFPAPARLGGVTYRDIWLWDRSGNFQLDTLTEGQRSR